MDSAKLNDWMQVVGIFALVASLIFVGLQMKQSQEIAIAAQYHDRTALAVENNNVQIESGILHLWGALSGKVDDRDLAAYMAEFTPEQWGRYYLFSINTTMQMDNHFFQYQSGFMEEEVWQAHRAFLKRLLRNPSFPVSLALSANSTPYRASFLELCDQLIAELEAETADRSSIE